MANFLVLQAARFGDLVQSKRLILSLKKEGKVHLAVDSSLAPLAKLLYPDITIHPFLFHGHDESQVISKNFTALTALRAIAPDLVYNCNFSELTGSICRLFPQDIIIGYRPAAVSRGGLLRSPWARLAFRLSHKRRISSLNLVDFWAWFTPAPIIPELVNPAAKPGGQGLGVTLSGREARRSLPMPVLAEAVRTLSAVLDSPRIVLLGSNAERIYARKLLRLLPPKIAANVEDLSGKTDWQGLMAAVHGLDTLITPDTGIMHLAAHLGVPAMAFFLSSAWCHETGPYGMGHTIWQASAPCAPCLESAPCPYKVICLDVFRDGGFARLLARTLTDGNILAENPPALHQGLQCWQSSLDGLGGVLRLVAGEDADAFMRKGARRLLAEWLGLAPEAVTGPVFTTQKNTADLGRLHDALLPAQEWMLPQGRYS